MSQQFHLAHSRMQGTEEFQHQQHNTSAAFSIPHPTPQHLLTGFFLKCRSDGYENSKEDPEEKWNIL